jgi:predicted molibdopterin-dependent oxidoreductase YjgC
MAQENVTITVNGKETEAPAGEILLETLKRLGIVVPTLCHDERLTPYGGCRLCVVSRRDGRGGLVPACSTPVQRGMVIETDAPEVIESRRNQLQLLALNHRMECPVCERRGDCRFQDLIYEYGSPEGELPFELKKAPRDEASPVIVRDPEKCIICGKCVRLCDEVQGVAAIGIINRGLEARVATLLERPLDCEFCGQCVNACPVGALVARPYVSDVPAWLRDSATTTCSFCSCGCQVTVETHDGLPQRVTADVTARPNSGKLCVKGWLGWDVLTSPNRLEAPLLRRNGVLVEVGWNEALDAVTTAITKAQEDKRPIIGVGSSRMTCEDAYLMQRFVRSTIGSPHVSLGPVGGAAALVEGIGAATGAPCSSAGFEEMAEADVVLVLCGDPTRTHPLVKTELVQGARQRGRQFVLAHALSGGLERHADLYLPLEPGSEDMLLHGVTAGLLKRNAGIASTLEGTAGFAEWAASLEPYNPEQIASCTGIAQEQLEGLTDRLTKARSVVAVLVTGLGIPGEEAMAARAATYLMATLEAGGARAGLLVLGEKANVQGVIDVGLHPSLLPGHRPAEQAAGWKAKEAMARAIEEEIGVMYLAGQDPVGAWPSCYRAREAVDGADYVVVQDAFLTPTARLADVVLPVRILAERLGTVVGADGVRRPLDRIKTTRTELPQDGQIFGELARRLGSELPDDGKIEKELAELLSWPHGKAAVRRFEKVDPPIPCPERDGILLDTSPQLFHSGSVTKHSRLLQELSPTLAVRISPHDARELGVRSGETIRLAVEERELLLRARIDRTVRRGTAVVPWQSSGGDSAASLIAEIGPPLAVSLRRSQ